MFNLVSWWRELKIQHLCRRRDWTRRQYDRNTDTDLNRYTSNVKECYEGYSTVLEYEDPSDTLIGMCEDMENPTWMDENLEGKWRMDIRGVSRDHTGAWIHNDFSGQIVLFAAFKNEKDAVLFRLRWE